MAPTRTTPWMAFVPDISGVCSIDGTRAITSKPTMIARMKTYAPRTISVMLSLLSTETGSSLVHTRDARRARDLIFGVEGEHTIFHQMPNDSRHIARVHLAGVHRDH